MNRRDLLKYFAAGTVIAPVSGSAPLARLIEVPKVELVKPELIEKPFNPSEVDKATIFFDMVDGSRRTAWVSDIYHGYYDNKPMGDDDLRMQIALYGIRRVSVPQNYIKWTMEGAANLV
jgi:hypothetical protein